MGSSSFMLCCFSILCISMNIAQNISKVPEKEAEEIRRACMPARSIKMSMNGEQAGNEDFKYAVRIVVEDNKYLFQCSGVIISSKHVLTAAHCFFNFDANIKKQLCKRNEQNELERQQLAKGKSLNSIAYVNPEDTKITVQYGSRCIKIKEEYADCDSAHADAQVQANHVAIHPSYLVDYCNSGDLAIVEVEKPINFTNVHLPNLKTNETTHADYACLPRPNTKPAPFLTLAGFGHDPKAERDPNAIFHKWLKFIKLTSKENCDGYLMTNTTDQMQVNLTMFDGLCTQSTEGVPCMGDSASPLVQKLDRASDKDIVIAIHSSAIPCQIANRKLKRNRKNNVKENDLRWNRHTDLRKHLGWICGITGLCMEGSRPDQEYERPLLLF